MKEKTSDLLVKGGSFSCAVLVAWLTMNCGELYSTTIRCATQIGEITQLDRAGMKIVLAMGCLLTMHVNRYHVEIDVHGKASFREADDPSRDRLVTAGPAIFRPLGTGFLVESNSSDVASIIVWQSAVNLFTRGSDGSLVDKGVVYAGERAIVTRSMDGVVHVRRFQVSSLEIRSALLWEQGRDGFDGETVRAAVHRFNSESRVQAIILDDSVANKPVYGTFDVRKPEQFEDVLHHVDGVNAFQLSINGKPTVVVTKKSP